MCVVNDQLAIVEELVTVSDLANVHDLGKVSHAVSGKGPHQQFPLFESTPPAVVFTRSLASHVLDSQVAGLLSELATPAQGSYQKPS